MTDAPPLKLFNSLTRQLEEFAPTIPGKASVYSCGPTVYNYQHIGNMRAYVFADTLGRVLRYKGYDVTQVINITDVGHLTSDADAGDDKMEKAASQSGKTAWDIAAFYQADFEADLARLNIVKPLHPKATDYVPAMIDWAKSIADKHCYELEGGLYFDTSTVPDYGRLARAATDAGEGRIDAVSGKRNPQDFAIWRKTPPGESRQMEWPSPWGMGAPGWHIECSVMSKALLDHPFDIHTGGIDHREIHHPNEIAQNQAHGRCDHSGASIWMHNNFLIDRRGKMSKSSGEFLRLQTLVDKGFHPLAYRLMCLQAHYRSEMEFTWEGLAAAFVRLKRLYKEFDHLKMRNHEVTRETWHYFRKEMTIQSVHPKDRIGLQKSLDYLAEFSKAVCEDLNTPKAIVVLETCLKDKTLTIADRIRACAIMDEGLGLGLLSGRRADLREMPIGVQQEYPALENKDITALIRARGVFKKLRRYEEADTVKNLLIGLRVEVMDGDSLSWDWRIEI